MRYGNDDLGVLHISEGVEVHHFIRTVYIAFAGQVYFLNQVFEIKACTRHRKVGRMPVFECNLMRGRIKLSDPVFGIGPMILRMAFVKQPVKRFFRPFGKAVRLIRKGERRDAIGIGIRPGYHQFFLTLVGPARRRQRGSVDKNLNLRRKQAVGCLVGFIRMAIFSRLGYFFINLRQVKLHQLFGGGFVDHPV